MKMCYHIEQDTSLATSHSTGEPENGSMGVTSPITKGVFVLKPLRCVGHALLHGSLPRLYMINSRKVCPDGRSHLLGFSFRSPNPPLVRLIVLLSRIFVEPQ